MKTIDNYINERLNPRHLGSLEYDFSKPFLIKDNIEWEFSSLVYGKHTINCNGWWCGVIDYYSYSVFHDHKCLIFWSEDADWMFCLYGPEEKKYWEAVGFDPIMKHKPATSIHKYLNKDFDRYCRHHVEDSLVNMIITQQISSICEKFESYVNNS